jgi:hypothetical protein
VDETTKTQTVSQGQGGKTSDVQGAGAGGQGAAGGVKPKLAAPALSAAAMMIALNALQSKMSQEGIQMAESTMDGVRTDIKANAKKRAAELKTYFEEMDKAAKPKKCGLFGAIANFFKKLFTGDIAGAFKGLATDLKESIGNILKDIAQIVGAALAIVAAAVATAATGGGASPLLALAIAGTVMMVAGMAMSDPAIMDMIIESLPEDQQKAAMIALMTVAAVLSLVGSIMSGIGSGGAGTATAIAKIAVSVASIISGAATIESGVKDYQRSQHQVKATESQVKMDYMDAAMEELKGILSQKQGDMKELYDSFAKILDSTRNMIAQQGQAQVTAASV